MASAAKVRKPAGEVMSFFRRENDLMVDVGQRAAKGEQVTLTFPMTGTKPASVWFSLR